MGWKLKGNPIKQLKKAAVDVLAKPTREVSRAVGADGLVSKIDSASGTVNALGDFAVDRVSGKYDQQKKQMQSMEAAAVNAATMENQKRAAAASAAETARIENERMSGGSKARTLLTGASGLDEEDENASYTRRTLMGF